MAATQFTASEEKGLKQEADSSATPYKSTEHSVDHPDEEQAV